MSTCGKFFFQNFSTSFLTFFFFLCTSISLSFSFSFLFLLSFLFTNIFYINYYFIYIKYIYLFCSITLLIYKLNEIFFFELSIYFEQSIHSRLISSNVVIMSICNYYCYNFFVLNNYRFG